MSRVLVLAAHPDDEVLGMGGTIALHAARGDEMRIVCVTDGSSTQYPGDTDLRERKSDEAKRAAAELGVEDYVHLALPDMRLDTVAHVDVNRPVEEQVRDFRPAIVSVTSTNQFGTNQFWPAGVHSVLDVGAYVRTRRTTWPGTGRVATQAESNSARWSRFTSGCGV